MIIRHCILCIIIVYLICITVKAKEIDNDNDNDSVEKLSEAAIIPLSEKIQYRYTVQFRTPVENQDQVKADQKAFLDYLKKHDIDVTVRYKYTGVMNGMSVQLDLPSNSINGNNSNSNNKEQMDIIHHLQNGTSIPIQQENGEYRPAVFLAQTLKSCPYVRRYWPGKRYPRPNVIHSSSSPLSTFNHDIIKPIRSSTQMDPGESNLDYAHTLTGVDFAKNTSITGKGIKVAILDSGVDYMHPALGGCFGKEGCLIRYGYDLVGDNYGDANKPQPDDNPRDLCNGHGTHVAGILAANDTTKNFQGVAPGVTLGVWRIFGCRGDTDDDIILAAADMALNTGMDIISLSLGGGIGAWSEDPLSVALSNLALKGITVVVAQGNEGKDGIGRTPSPAIGKHVISVASVDNGLTLGHQINVFNKNEELGNFEFLLTEGSQLTTNETDISIAVLHSDRTANRNEEMACNPILSQNVTNKLVLVKRGGCDFGQKAINVQNAGGIGLLVYNHPGEEAISLDLQSYPRVRIPIGSLSGDDGEALTRLYRNTKDTTEMSIKVSTHIMRVKNVGRMSEFSTWGPDPELHFKPDIAGIGGYVYSTYPVELGSYTSLSGTSMATPYISGCIALIMEATGLKSPEDVTRGLLNYAKPISLVNDDDNLESLVKQGAGLVNVQNSVLGSTYVHPYKISLNDTQHFKNSTQLTIENKSNQTKTYQLSHIPAMGVLSYDFERNDTPLDKAIYEKVSAIVKFEFKFVTLKPLETKNITIYFEQPSMDLQLQENKKNGIDLHVPYYGVLGNQYDLPIFDSKKGYPFIGDLKGRPDLSQDGPKKYDFSSNSSSSEVLHILIRLVNPTSMLKCELIKNNVTVGYIPRFHNTWVSRNENHDVSYAYSVDWRGSLTKDYQLETSGNNNTETFSAISGTYNIRLSALKIFGNPKIEKDWETWTSNEIEVIA
ncbi:unnamed protein product [Cunninghamella echinulata]